MDVFAREIWNSLLVLRREERWRGPLSSRRLHRWTVSRSFVLLCVSARVDVILGRCLHLYMDFSA